MAFTEDPAELIAAAMLTYLGDAARDFDADVDPTFSVPADPSEELKRETAGCRVLLVPSGDTETKYQRGTKVEAEHRVSVIVICPTTATLTKRKLNGFVYAVKKSLRAVDMSGYVWTSTESNTKYDPDNLRERAQFLSAFQVSYYGIE